MNELIVVPATRNIRGIETEVVRARGERNQLRWRISIATGRGGSTGGPGGEGGRSGKGGSTGSGTADGRARWPLGSLRELAAGAGYTCAVTNAGGAKCWGTNSMGELGIGRATDSLPPVPVAGLSTGRTTRVGSVIH